MPGSILSAEEPASPLDSLRNRSPESRWEERTQKILQAKPKHFRPLADLLPEVGKDIATETQPVTVLQEVVLQEQEVVQQEKTVQQEKFNAPAAIPLPPQPVKPQATIQPTIEPFEQFPIEQSPTEVQQVALQPSPDTYEEPARNPQQLNKITDILPFFDYEPDADIAKDDICMNLCPRPDGKPCKVYPEGENVPECPEEFSLGDDEFLTRHFEDTVYTWQASNLFSNPLYFEDVNLERYALTHHELLQPFISIGKFSVQLAGLPYQMVIDPPRNCRYALGYYRPGECTPRKYKQIPWNWEAAILQGEVITGAIFAFP